jgi:pyridoxal phosphate enzyme (YggS family)
LSVTVSERLREVRTRIERAALRSGRPPEKVTLVAVAKTFPPSAVAEAAGAGQIHFGENRVQEASRKIPLSPAGLVWHLVGHLQGNKVKAAAGLFTWVHAVDSPDLARALDGRLAALGRKASVLVEVKLSPEESKFGVPPEEARRLVEEMILLPRLAVRGLMTMPPLNPEPEAARPYFRTLAGLAGEMARILGQPSFDQLSMGMSGDFEVAVEEGATMVRIGAAIFGERDALGGQADV